jgi:NADH-quinone oxidoreductase subunit A
MDGHDPSYFDLIYPLVIILLVGAAIPAGMMGLNSLLSWWSHGFRNTHHGKEEQYESGMPVSLGGAGEKFSIKFYLIAMLFLAFDIEVAFLYPWAYQFNSGGWEMVWLLVVFLVLLEVGYVYLYKKGALDWE